MHELSCEDLPESWEERLAMALALIRRADLRSDGFEALRQRYPHLPDPVLSTAAHHIYADLPWALVDLLAVLELGLREPHREISSLASLHVLHHLYNWSQLQALLPHGIHELDALAKEAQEALDQGESTAVKEALRELRKRLDGDLSPPDFE